MKLRTQISLLLVMFGLVPLLAAFAINVPMIFDRFELLYHKQEMGWCELKSPVAGVNVGLSQVEKLPGRGGNAVLTWGVKNLDLAREALEAQGVRFDGESQTLPGMVKLATFFDPDDNCLMLYEDLAAMHTEGS